MTPFSTRTLAALLITAAFSTPAQADQFSDYTALSARITQLAGSKGHKAAPPEGRKAEMAAIVAKLADHQHFLGKRRFAMSEFGQLVAMCRAAEEVLATYTEFGFHEMRAENNNVVERMINTSQLAKKNTATYYQQTVPMMVFVNKCNASAVTTFRDFLPANAAEIDAGMREMVVTWRSAFNHQFAVLNMVATGTALSLKNRQAIYSAVAESAPLYAQILNQSTRVQLHSELSNKVSVLKPQLRPMHEQVMNALRDTPCDLICQL